MLGAHNTDRETAVVRSDYHSPIYDNQHTISKEFALYPCASYLQFVTPRVETYNPYNQTHSRPFAR